MRETALFRGAASGGYDRAPFAGALGSRTERDRCYGALRKDASDAAVSRRTTASWSGVPGSA